MIGETLGHYRIESQLGAGGMGVVYRAYDTRLERPVAVKVIGEALQSDETARARLIQEARSASALNHAGICTIHEVGESGGRAFIVMEYVEGRTLTSMIPVGGLPVETVVRYGAQIADALSHAHDRGVVHRDLKSANVIVTPEGRLKVLDFGLAKRTRGEGGDDETLARGLTEAGVIVGTLAYMSPEVLRGETADARSDIWALGILLYEMTSGKLPFQGKSAFDLTAAILRERVPELPAGGSAGLQPVIHNCLAQEPGERYQRAGEVRAALEAIGSSTRTMPAVVSPPTRRRWLWPIAGAAALGAAGVAGVVLWRAPRTYAPLPSKVPAANAYFQRALSLMTVQMDHVAGRLQLEKALEADPKFAHARAWYAFTHVLLLDGGISNDTTWLYKAEEELRRALRDDPNSARAHVALAALSFWLGRREQVRQAAEKTTELDPNERGGYMWLGVYHRLNGDYEPSQRLIRKLLEQDPLFPPARVQSAENLRQMGDTAGAIRESRGSVEDNPKNIYALMEMAVANMDAGDMAAARRAMEAARPQFRQNYRQRICWALLMALEGKAEEARREMDPEVLKYAELGPFASYAAEFYAILGDKAIALDWLDKAVRWGDERAEWFERDPLLSKVREEPRFRQILESIRYRREQRVKAIR